jgi:hypothetical protein
MIGSEKVVARYGTVESKGTCALTFSIEMPTYLSDKLGFFSLLTDSMFDEMNSVSRKCAEILDESVV